MGGQERRNLAALRSLGERSGIDREILTHLFAIVSFSTVLATGMGPNVKGGLLPELGIAVPLTVTRGASVALALACLAEVAHLTNRSLYALNRAINKIKPAKVAQTEVISAGIALARTSNPPIPEA